MSEELHFWSLILCSNEHKLKCHMPETTAVLNVLVKDAKSRASVFKNIKESLLNFFHIQMNKLILLNCEVF